MRCWLGRVRARACIRRFRSGVKQASRRVRLCVKSRPVGLSRRRYLRRGINGGESRRRPRPIRVEWRRSDGRRSSAPPQKRRSDRRGVVDMRLKNYVYGEWVASAGRATDLYHAVTGEKIAEASTDGIDFGDVLHYARSVGGPALRAMTFHQRGRILK